jgi:hypothetical protein
MFLRNTNEKQLYLWTHHFERKCVCSPNVWRCGNVSLTDGLAFDKLLFRDRITTITTTYSSSSLTLHTPVVIIRTTRFNVQTFYVLRTQIFAYGPHNKQLLFPYTALTDRFL